MRRLPFLVLLCLSQGCNYAPIANGLTTGLALTGQAPHYEAHRSTRWTIADPSSVILTGDYDPATAADQRFLAAAHDGLRRIFPQTSLQPAPLNVNAASMAAAVADEPAELRVHVVVPRYADNLPLPGAASAFDVEVALLDGRTGRLIERARLRLAPAWWQANVGHRSIADLFENYAAQLIAVQ